MKAKAIVLGVLSIMAATVTLSKTAGQVFARSQPQLALTMDPSNPDARARLASLLVSRTDPDAAALERARALSLEVLQTTPADVAALRTLGMVEARSDPERGAALVGAAAGFAKRDTASQLWLVNHYGQRGQEQRALVSLGAALRTSVASRALLFPALLQTVGQRASQQQLVRLLAPPTDWSGAFWSFAAGAPELPQGLADLIVGVRRAGGTLPRQPLRDLVERLATDGRIADALAVMAATEPRTDMHKAFVGLQEFGGTALPRPFSWDVTSTGRVYGQVVEPGELQTDVRPGSQGIVARRLVALPRAGATVTGTLTVTSGPQSDAPAFVVRCAGSGTVLLNHRPRGRTTAIAATVTVPRDCPYQWVEIVSPEVRSAEGSRAIFSGVTLRAGLRR